MSSFRSVNLLDIRPVCLISFALKTHRRFPLILVAHRDEFYKRDTAAMHWWKNDMGDSVILAGKDNVGGGTWFGVSPLGKWAAVTNYRERHPERPDVQTRGRLVLDYLSGDAQPTEYLKGVAGDSQKYNGFNLLVGKSAEVYWFSNRDPNPADPSPLPLGVYGLSNHLLNTDWPKVQLAKQCLTDRITSDEIEAADLVDVLFDESRPPDDLLPDTGVEPEMEKLLSSMFIESESMNYGTRCSTAMTISNDAKFSVAELTYPERKLAEFTFET